VPGSPPGALATDAPSARQRARGNVRQRFGAVDAALPPPPTGGADGGSPGPQGVAADGGVSAAEPSASPWTASAAAGAGATVGGRQTVSFAPKPKADPPHAAAPAAAAKKAKEGKNKPAAAKAPTEQLTLAEKARERVRERREQRAKEGEAPASDASP
jgi:hypothetical protein